MTASPLAAELQQLLARCRNDPAFQAQLLAQPRDTLAAAGLAHARLVVLTFARPQTALRIAQAVLDRRLSLSVVVATERVTDAQLLRNLPNVRLYPLYLAAGLGLAEQVLLMLGINADQVDHRIEELRQTLSESGGDRP